VTSGARWRFPAEQEARNGRPGCHSRGPHRLPVCEMRRSLSVGCQLRHAGIGLMRSGVINWAPPDGLGASPALGLKAIAVDGAGADARGAGQRSRGLASRSPRWCLLLPLAPRSPETEEPPVAPRDDRLRVSAETSVRTLWSAHRGLAPSKHRGVPYPVAGPSRVTPDAAPLIALPEDGVNGQVEVRGLGQVEVRTLRPSRSLS